MVMQRVRREPTLRHEATVFPSFDADLVCLVALGIRGRHSIGVRHLQWHDAPQPSARRYPRLGRLLRHQMVALADARLDAGTIHHRDVTLTVVQESVRA